MEIEIRIYDMTGTMVFRRTFFKGAEGGRLGYNVLGIDSQTFGVSMQAGVYFVLVMSDGKVIGKTKFAVVP
jgi:hypothetical protein